MDFNFNENQQIVRDLANEFAQKCLAPRIDEIEKAGHMPLELFAQAGEMGLLGVELPEEYGGSDLGAECAVLVMEEVAKVSAPVALAMTTHISVLGALLRAGTEAQKRKYLPDGAAGKYIASMAFTEAGTGSDPKQLTTKAVWNGSCFTLSGVKRFITNSAYPGPFLVFAREEDGACTAFLFEKGCEGYSLSTPWEKVGYHSSPVYDVFLDNVRVPEDSVLGARGSGFSQLLTTSTHGKLSHVGICLGIMETCNELAVKYAMEKLHRDDSILKFQAVQLKIAHLAAKLESARWYAYHMACTAQDIKDPAELQAKVSLAKAFMCDLAPEYVQLAMSVMGPYGVMSEYRVERYMRDALIEPIIEVVSDVQRIIYGSYVYRQARQLRG